MAHQHSQSGGSSATTLIDATVEALFQGQTASPQEGLSLITDWFSSVKNSKQAGAVMQPLTELQEELQSTAPSNAKLSDLLMQLADTTEGAAETADGDFPSRLQTLATALRNFAGQLSTAV